MSPIRLIILAVAGLAAVMAAFLVRNLAGGSAAVELAEPVERIVEVQVSQIKVLVVRSDLRVGTLLTPDDFGWADWPEATVNLGYFTQDNAPEAIEELTGSVVRVALYTDEPVLPQKIVQKGETGFMAALLRPGMRAASVEISPESASAGFILPDDRVDVILTQQIEIETSDGQQENTITRTILVNARILAIDQTFGDLDGVPTLTGSTATMELTPDQAEMMALAAGSGQISLTLRSYADVDFNEGNALSKVDLSEGAGAGGGVTIYRSGKAATGGS